MPGTDPDDEGARPPPDPRDRPWIHPSELAGAQRRAAPRRVGSAFRRDVVLALSAGTIGAVAAVTVLGLAGAFTHDTATPPRAETAAVRDAAGVAASVAPAITAVIATSGGAQRRGSGVTVSSHEILTTTDVVGDPAASLSISVTTADGRRHDAEIRGRDPVTGLVLLDVKSLRAQPVRWSDTDAIRAGDWVVAVGRTPARPWVTSGVVTAVGGWMTDAAGYSYAGVITTSTELADDARGGALVDQHGRVVGILASSASAPARTSVLPSDMAGDVAAQLSEHGHASHGALGVRAADGPNGVSVTAVIADSGAAHAGIRTGDRITGIDGVRTPDTATLVYELRRRPGGTRVTLTVHRAGTKTLHLAANLDDTGSGALPSTSGVAPLTLGTGS